MACFVCASRSFLIFHGSHQYCSRCVDENWCIHEDEHCCNCNKKENITQYGNKSYCIQCYDDLSDGKMYAKKCTICHRFTNLEQINDVLYCNDCATEKFKIKKCDKCQIRHLKEFCFHDFRYDPWSKKDNLCNVCGRIHLNPNYCKYCKICKDYIPYDYEHCDLCGLCDIPNRPH
jgi:hypothetical protein